MMHGIDVETAGYDGDGVLEPEDGRLRLVQISDGKNTDVYDAFRQDADVIRRAVQAHKKLVAHNATFERKWLDAALSIDRADLEDTMVMSQVLYTGTRAALSGSFTHSLQAVAKRELKRKLSKEEQTSDWSAEALTKEQIEYAALDAAILPRLVKTLRRKIDRAKLRKVYDLERRVSHAVAAMEHYGVAIHRDKLEEMIPAVTEEATRLKTELAEEWGINPGSSKQLREHFGLDEREDWPKTKSGKSPATDKNAMRALLGEEPGMEKWFEWKAVDKIRSTYGKSILDRLTDEGRVHGRFKSFGTVTGRFSSADPNLQNIPKRGERGKRMRGLFWSGSDDRVLIKADYASIELWVAAVLWDDPHMQHALRRGVNMHVATAASLFDVPPAEVTDEQKATGKIVNFALLYGGSPNRILEEFAKAKIPIDEAGAQEMHAKFFATYTGFNRRREEGRQAYNDSKYRGNNHHDARTAIGRRRTFADWYGPLLNLEVQGTAADGLKFALARLYEDRAAFPEAHLVLTVHDELVIEAPKEQEDAVKEWMEHHMVEGMLEGVQRERDDVPSLPVVEIETGKEWS